MSSSSRSRSSNSASSSGLRSIRSSSKLRPATSSLSSSSISSSISSSTSSSSQSWLQSVQQKQREKQKSQFTLKNEDDFPGVGYLEKDAQLQRMNSELEKKSQEIFARIEQYYKKDGNSRETGDGDTGENPVLPENDDSFNGNDESDLEKSTSSSTSTMTMTPFNAKKNKTTAASDETKDVDLKARRRLQKATDSVVQCLQSKLISHEARLADLYIQFRQKIQENTMLEGKIRALEDDRERLVKSLNNLQNAAEKSTKSAEIAKGNLSAKMAAFTALKKDVETLRRDQKCKSNTLQNLQTRLNRSLEENERLKQHARSQQQNTRDKQTEDRLMIEELEQRVCQLEQQKSILNATIGKQAGLIKTLKSQQQ